MLHLGIQSFGHDNKTECVVTLCNGHKTAVKRTNPDELKLLPSMTPAECFGRGEREKSKRSADRSHVVAIKSGGRRRMLEKMGIGLRLVWQERAAGQTAAAAFIS